MGYEKVTRRTPMRYGKAAALHLTASPILTAALNLTAEPMGYEKAAGVKKARLLAATGPYQKYPVISYLGSKDAPP